MDFKGLKVRRSTTPRMNFITSSHDRFTAPTAFVNSSVIISPGLLTFNWETLFSILFSRKRNFSYQRTCQLNLNSFLIVRNTAMPSDSLFVDRHAPSSIAQMSTVGIEIGPPNTDPYRSTLSSKWIKPFSMRPSSAPMNYRIAKSTKFLIRPSCKHWRNFEDSKRRSR